MSRLKGRDAPVLRGSGLLQGPGRVRITVKEMLGAGVFPCYLPQRAFVSTCARGVMMAGERLHQGGTVCLYTHERHRDRAALAPGGPVPLRLSVIDGPAGAGACRRHTTPPPRAADKRH